MRGILRIVFSFGGVSVSGDSPHMEIHKTNNIYIFNNIALFLYNKKFEPKIKCNMKQPSLYYQYPDLIPRSCFTIIGYKITIVTEKSIARMYLSH